MDEIYRTQVLEPPLARLLEEAWDQNERAENEEPVQQTFTPEGVVELSRALHPYGLSLTASIIEGKLIGDSGGYTLRLHIFRSNGTGWKKNVRAEDFFQRGAERSPAVSTMAASIADELAAFMEPYTPEY